MITPYAYYGEYLTVLMSITVTLILLTITVEDILAQQSRDPLVRIVGGKEVDISVVPYTVAILEGNFYICVGSYIRPLWILTAAHCIEDYAPPGMHAINFDKLFLQMGASTLFDFRAQSRMSVALVLHEKYKRREYAYDIALIRISNRFVLNDEVSMIPLIMKRTSYGGQTAIVAGWGYEAFLGDGLSVRIQAVKLNLVPKTKCKHLYREDVKLADDALCAGNGNDYKDACHGDSGAALAFEKPTVQVGLVSWGFGCGTELPGVYTDVYYHRKWIINKTKDYVNYGNSELSCRCHDYNYVLMLMLMLLNVIA